MTLLWGLPDPVASASPGKTSTAAPSAVLEHSSELQHLKVQGLRPRELSALAWDSHRQELVAASDRGHLFRLMPPVSGGAWQVLLAQRLADVPGSDAPPNAESLAWRPRGEAGGELWLAAENDARAWRVSPTGQLVDGQSWPLALQPHLNQGRHGIEAMAWHAELGLLAALQKPLAWQQGSAQLWHAVHASGGARWLLAPSGPRSSLKAIEPLPGHALLVMERVAVARAGAGPSGWRTVLRWLHLPGCGESVPCVAPVVPVTPALPEGPDNFEGLACTQAGRCWLASDSGGRQGLPTRLLQLQLKELP